MTFHLCQVTGTLVAPDGSLLPEVQVQFLPAPVTVRGAQGETQAPHPVSVTTDTGACLDVALAPGVYTVRARTSEGRDYPPFLIDVPGQEAAAIADILLHLPAPQSVYDAAASARMAGRSAGDAAAHAQAADSAAAVAWAAAEAAGGGSEAFASRAAFEAAHLPDSITTWSVLHGNILLHYARDPQGTAIESANGVKGRPAGDLYVQHFAENTVPGTTDLRLAVQRAVQYAASLSHKEARPAGLIALRTGGEPVAMGGQVWFDNLSGVLVTDAVFCGIGDWLPNRALFRITNSDRILFDDVSFFGRHATPGFVWINNSSFCEVRNCTGHGCTEFAVRSTGTAGALRVSRNRFSQFLFNEAGGGAPESRTAVLLDIGTTDSIVDDNIVSLARIPLRVRAGASQVMGNHPWNGNITGPSPAPVVCAEIFLNSGVVSGNYFDNGVVLLGGRTSGALTYSNNFHLQLEGNLGLQGMVALVAENGQPNVSATGLVLVGNTFNRIAGTPETPAWGFVEQGTGSFTAQLNAVCFGNVLENGQEARSPRLPNRHVGARRGHLDLPLVENANTLVYSGTYRTNDTTSNIPGAFGTLVHYGGSASSQIATQLWMPNSGDEAWHTRRSNAAGVWSAWGTLLDSRSASPVPVVDSGSGPLGSWTKFSDGRMLVERTLELSGIDVNTAYGNVWRSNNLVAETAFPQPFAAGSLPIISIQAWVSNAMSWTLVAGTHTNAGWPGIIRVASATLMTDRTVCVSMRAEGRWK